jgi:hypothetical protein
MTQTLYAHMKKIKIKKKDCGYARETWEYHNYYDYVGTAV